MGKKSKTKGDKGELEVAKWLSDRGYAARRGRQYKGTPDSPDVQCKPLGMFHLESKRVERFHIWNALHKATEDAAWADPVVFTRRNREDWVVVMWAEDWLKLVTKAHYPNGGADVSEQGTSGAAGQGVRPDDDGRAHSSDVPEPSDQGASEAD